MKKEDPAPGDGIRSLRTSHAFRIVNFELYTKPNKIIMGVGILAFAFSAVYIAYMRQKYEDMGYYTAVLENGEEELHKKKSRWD